MSQLDATIANVALPHMQGSTSATREQITWVLTSYIVMAAIFTPLAGWLAGRFGRKRIIVTSIIGFTVASVLCGVAANLYQLVAFRLLQGAFGAALLPMTQAILLDINPPEKHGSAMAIWGMGAIFGPLVGPIIGGWLTDQLTWRWVFFINVPAGLMAVTGLLLYLNETRDPESAPFDLFGFSMLALAVGSFQLMLDRGQLLDWFQSREIWIYATLAAGAIYVFVIHTITAKRPFIDPHLFADSNYVIGSIFGFFLGGLVYGVVALLPPMLAELMGYPILTVGWVMVPRGAGTLITMLVIGQLISRFDPRLLMFAGLMMCAASMWVISGVTLEMDSRPVIISGFLQGVGTGMMFVPITTIVFATLAPRYRNQGAALNSLIRNLGASVWISVVQFMTIRNADIAHAGLVDNVRPDNPMMDFSLPDFDFGVPQAVAAMEREIFRQALMVAYAETFWLLFLACCIVAPLILLLKPTKQAEDAAPVPMDMH